MTRRVASVLASVMLLVLLPISALAGIQNNNEEPKTPVVQSVDPVVKCSSVRLNNRLRVNCSAAGVSVFSTVVDLPMVRVTVPGPTSTRTIEVDVPIPGEPGATVTKRVEVPGPTETIRRPGPTRTISPEAPTVTITETPEEGRQDGTTPDTIGGPDNDRPVVTFPETNLSTWEAIGVGILGVLAIIGLILIGMYTGYYMGDKHGERRERTFIKSLLNKNK